jgi:hypothetical protein
MVTGSGGTGWCSRSSWNIGDFDGFFSGVVLILVAPLPLPMVRCVVMTIMTMTVAHPIFDNLAGPSDAAVILLVHRLNKLVEYPHIFLLLLLLPKKSILFWFPAGLPL